MAEKPKRAAIPEILGLLEMPMSTETVKVEIRIEKRMHTRKNPGIMAETI